MGGYIDRLGDQGYAPGETDDGDSNVQTITIINGQMLPPSGTRKFKRTCAIKELRRPEIKLNIPALMNLVIPVPEQLTTSDRIDQVQENITSNEQENSGPFIRNRPERRLDDFPLFPLYDNY